MKTQNGVELIDQILEAWEPILGRDYLGYRNHCCRVQHFCTCLSSGRPVDENKIAIAAAFHDLGIWECGSLDYLASSTELMRKYLDENRDVSQINDRVEIETMIEYHHKITRYRKNPEWLVEPFRKADWIDISYGSLLFGLDKAVVRQAFKTYPSAGFHRGLIVMAKKRLRTHPFSPLPMIKL